LPSPPRKWADQAAEHTASTLLRHKAHTRKCELFLRLADTTYADIGKMKDRNYHGLNSPSCSHPLSFQVLKGMEHIHCDVLVLGAGLAGLRAAWAAKEHAPSLSVLVATGPSGPSGSSFANRNNALGMQVLLSDEECRIFVREVLDLAPPGTVDETLVQLLARESEARFRDLQSLGLDFRREENGTAARQPGCGSPYRRAAIFDNLAHTFNQFIVKTNGCSIDFATNTSLLGLLKRDGRCVGAWGMNNGGTPVTFQAGATILALGGPAPLYQNRICGTGNTGLALGMLREVGAKTANESFLQFMWYDGHGRFQNLTRLLGNGAYVVRQDGRRVIPDIREDLLASREGHCPAFYGREDATTDEFLLSHAWEDGWCRVELSGEVVLISLMAHAGNGGAVVNAEGATSLKGLYAAGECATGMHGANRMGGAMVLATQVFGRRAGLAAAELAEVMRDVKRPDAKLPPGAFALHDDQYRIDMDILRKGMQRHALFGPRSGLETFRMELREIERSSDDRRTLVATGSALAIAEHALAFAEV